MRGVSAQGVAGGGGTRQTKDIHQNACVAEVVTGGRTAHLIGGRTRAGGNPVQMLVESLLAVGIGGGRALKIEGETVEGDHHWRGRRRTVLSLRMSKLDCGHCVWQSFHRF